MILFYGSLPHATKLVIREALKSLAFIDYAPSSPCKPIDSANGDEVDPGGAATATMAGLAGGNSSSHAKSYECNFCKRGFLNAQALGGHMNIHRRDKATKTLMKPGACNYQSNPQYFGSTNYSASSSKGNIDMKKRREDDGVNEREKRKLDMEAGELDLELRLWSDGTARNQDSSRSKDFF